MFDAQGQVTDEGRNALADDVYEAARIAERALRGFGCYDNLNAALAGPLAAAVFAEIRAARRDG